MADTARARRRVYRGESADAGAHPALVALGLAAAIALALFFRLYRLDTLLHWAFGDEMSYGIEGQRVLHGQYRGLFAYTWDAAPATYAYLLAAVQQLFGATLHNGRLVSVATGVLCVPLTALFARELELPWTGALLAAGLLAVSHWHAHFSRMMLPAVTTTCVLLLALYLAVVAFRRGRWWLAAIAGAACGFAPYMFLSNRIIVAILALWLVYLAACHHAWVREHWPLIALFAAAFTLTVLPLARFWLHDTDWFLAPERHVGVMYNVSYWAGQHPGQPATAWNILLQQIPLALGMFVVNGGPYPAWGGTFAPALDAVTGWLFFAAVPFALLYRWRNPAIALVLIWAIAIWFFGVVLTIDAPQMEHAVEMTPAIFLLIAVLVDAVGRALGARLRRPWIYGVLAALLLAVSALLNYQAYFLTWGSQLAGANGFSWQFYDAATYVGRQPTPHGTAIYSWGYPDEFFRFLAPRAGEFPGDPRAFKPASLYIVLAGDAVQPSSVAAHVPGARMQRVYDADGDLAFTAIVPPTP